MEVIQTDSYGELSNRACELLKAQIKHKPDSVLGLATGGTPLGTYRELQNSCKKGDVDFTFVKAINLDEYVGLSPDHPQSYRMFMKQTLFSGINIDERNTYIPNGVVNDLNEECRRYERIIEEIGPPDLQILGIGKNGHIGFNEPGSSFASETHVVNLTPSTRNANARFFTSIEEVPTQAITMGIRSILKSKAILLLASGEEKAMAIQRLMSEEPNERFPASSLKQHPNVILIIDKAASHLITKKEDRCSG